MEALHYDDGIQFCLRVRSEKFLGASLPPHTTCTVLKKWRLGLGGTNVGGEQQIMSTRSTHNADLNTVNNMLDIELFQ